MWEAIEPLLPAHPSDRAAAVRPWTTGRALGQVNFVLMTRIAWRHVPRELGVSLATPHRRLQEWEAGGVFARLHGVLLERLNAAGRID